MFAHSGISGVELNHINKSVMLSILLRYA